MAAKRFLDESGSDQNRPTERRIRTRPSFASVIGKVVMGNSLHNFCSALEPVLRRVVHEEVEHGIRRRTLSVAKSPSLRIKPEEAAPSCLKLIFSNELSLPIFTGSKIADAQNNPLLVLVVDATTTSNHEMIRTSLPYPIKVEIVVLDGDFPTDDRRSWTSEEFNYKMVKERTGKRPLLTGDLLVTLRDGFAPVGDIEFTDNSSWIRSRKFRLGARVVAGGCGEGGSRIREGMTERFVVKDHRGELYKKHHPPSLADEVWRLEKIGKDGVFHKKLAFEGINTVQDFLKLSMVDPMKLRKILGAGMSEKMWEVTIKHARTCIIGTKLYLYRGPDFIIFLNPICQVVRAMINGQIYTCRDLTNNRAYLEKLVREAYLKWTSLEEVEELLNETALLTQGDSPEQYPKDHQTVVKSFQQYGGSLIVDLPIEAGCLTSNTERVGSSDWMVNPDYLSTPVEHGINFNFSESSSNEDFTPSRPFINRNRDT